MATNEVIQVVLSAQDYISSKVKQATDSIRNMGTASQTASNIANNATTRLANTYDQLRNKVNNAWNSIKQTMQNSTLGQAVSSSGLAKPFLNAAEQVRQRWTSMTETIKSRLAGIAGNKVITIRGENGDVIKKIQVTKSELDKIKNANVDPFKNISTAGLKVLNGELGQATIKASQFNGTAVQVGSTVKSTSTQFAGFGAMASQAFQKASAGVQSFKAKLSGAKNGLMNLASGLSGLQGMIMSAFGAVGVTSMKSFIIDSAIAREKVNAVTKSVTGTEQAFKKVNASIKSATAGTTLGYNNMAKAVNNVALRFHVTGDAVSGLAAPMGKIGVLAQAMGKSTEEAASVMEHAYDGLMGKWKSLKQYDITEDELRKAGWSGAANDVDGYSRALDKVLERNPNLKEFTNTFEYQFEMFKMSVRGVGTEIGMKVLPILRKLIEGLNDLAQNHPELLKIVVIIGMVVLSLSSLAMMVLPILQVVMALKELEVVTTLVSAAQAVLNAVMAMNPITAVIIIIVALVAALIYLYNTNEDVRNTLNGLCEFLVGSFAGAWEYLDTTLHGIYDFMVGSFVAAWDWIQGAFNNASLAIDGLMQWLNGLYQTFLSVLPLIMAILMPWTLLFNQQFTETASQAVSGFITWISTLPGKLWTWLLNTVNKVLEWRNQTVQNMKDAATQAVNGFIKYISTLPGKLWNWLLGAIDKAKQFVKDFVDNLKRAAVDAVNRFSENFDIAKIVTNALDNARHSIENMGGKLVSAMRHLAQRMWDSFWAIFTPGASMDDVVARMDNVVSRTGSSLASADNVVRRVSVEQLAGSDSRVNYGVTHTLNSNTSRTNGKLDNILEVLEDILDTNNETLTNNSSGVESNVSLEQTGTITIQHEVDLTGTPEGIDEENLIQILKQLLNRKDIIKELVNNDDFQRMDKRVKQRILGEYARHI